MNKRDKTMKIVRTVISITSTFLVDMFVGAVTNSVMHGVKGGKLARIGAKAGGFLVGMYIGDQVADHICEGIEDVMEDIDQIEIDTAAEEGA